MADEQRERDQPSLELPSLFTRRKGVKKPEPTPVELDEAPEVTRTPQPSPVELVETNRRPLPPLLASTITGALTGLLTVGLVWLALRGCSAVRDTSSCGDSGFLLLLSIVVVMAVAGRALLRAWRVPDPGSTSILATALMAVLTMLFLMGSLEDTWTVVVLPVLGAVTFALAQWVTSTNTSPGDRIR
jgi:hypothetical protein